MTNVERLRAWAEEEKKKGLVDIDFFPGSDPTVTLEEAAGTIVEALTSEDTVDITDEEL